MKRQSILLVYALSVGLPDWYIQPAQAFYSQSLDATALHRNFFCGFSRARESLSSQDGNANNILPQTNTNVFKSRKKTTIRMIASSPSQSSLTDKGKSRKNRKRSDLQWSGTRFQRSVDSNTYKTFTNSNRSVAITKKPMPITGYDANEICERYDRRPLEVGWRLNSLGFPMVGCFFNFTYYGINFPKVAHICVLLIPIVLQLGWYFGLLIDKTFNSDKKEDVQRKRGEELRNILVRSGSVALIKVS